MGFNNRSCTILLTVALLIFVARFSFGEQVDTNEQQDDTKLSRISKIFSIPSWSSYMKFFNKRYSSLSQQLLRQKLFVARAIEVYLTRIKYGLSQLSYFTAINEYSDLTPDECQRRLSGDQDNEGTSLEPALDDEEAEKLLLEMVDERRAEDSDTGSSGNSVQRLRRRRSLDGDVSSSDSKTKIRWRVPSENPDYEPIHMDAKENQAAREHIAEDIPADTAAEIEIGTEANGYKLSDLASGSLGRMKTMIGGAMDWLSASQPEEDDHETQAEPETIVIQDWRQSGCIGPVRNQGDCLSCYAVSSMGYMEWALCRHHGNELTPLSIQYMVSCGPQYNHETGGRVKLDGCNLGSSRQTVDFIREYGIELETNMPYVERDTDCPVAPLTPRKKKGYIRPNAKPVVRLKSKTTQLDLALETGPVIVAMREPKNFLAYGGGMVEHCYQRGGHAMLIVASMIENGVEYLLIKNSFGTDWGYDGYFKFKRSSIGECVKEFIVPRVNFPCKKAQARRIKAYLADYQSSSDGVPDIAIGDADIFDSASK